VPKSVRYYSNARRVFGLAAATAANIKARAQWSARRTVNCTHIEALLAYARWHETRASDDASD